MNDLDNGLHTRNRRMRYTFGPFELDTVSRCLTKNGSTCSLAARHFDVLQLLVSHAGTLQARDALIDGAWRSVAVSNNSLEQAISVLRRTLGPSPEGDPYIETVPGRGYRFVGCVQASPEALTRDGVHQSPASPHSFRATRTARDPVGAPSPSNLSSHDAPSHIALATAHAFAFELTRVEGAWDTPSLQRAIYHARAACDLAAHEAEAWATLAFVLHQSDRKAATAAALQAVSLDRGNWRHFVRLALVSWGEQRLSAASHALTLLPELPLAHWLMATVYVARQEFELAEVSLANGISSQQGTATGDGRFRAVGLHWLHGLLLLRRGAEETARSVLLEELSTLPHGHLYARKYAANTWYALGAIGYNQKDLRAAIAGFTEALHCIPRHPQATAALAALSGALEQYSSEFAFSQCVGVLRGDGRFTEAAIAAAILDSLRGNGEFAVDDVHETLRNQADAASGWMLPVEPILRAHEHSQAWKRTMELVRARAS